MNRTSKASLWFNSMLSALVASAFCVAIAAPCGAQQGGAPKYEVDPSWPKPLPQRWVTGAVSGVCTDSKDHVFILNRGNLTENELDSGLQAPPVIEFDPQGNVVNSWGDRDSLPEGLHGCFVDYQDSVWISGSDDAVVQKYSHDGGKLLLQMGRKGFADSSDGTLHGIALNSSHAGFYRPSAVAVDPGTGEIYVADGEEPGSNRRIVVFDRTGHFLRQWGLHRSGTEADVRQVEEFIYVPHCVALGKDGLVYVCDRRGNQIQVFDKLGEFQKGIPVPYEKRSQFEAKPGHTTGSLGTAVWLAFSADQKNQFMFVMNEDNEQVDVIDRLNGKVLSTFGRAGHQVGEFTFAHTLAVDSKNNVYVGEAGGEEAGNRVQRFKPAAQ